MPYTLKQLEDRRDSCIKKIQELKETAKDKGAVELRSFSFNAIGFFNGLVKMNEEEMDAFFYQCFLVCLKYLNVQDKRQMKKKEEDLKNKLQI